MLVNDHLLKGSGVVPGVVTGKLSDLAFLFFAPIVLAYATRARTRLEVLGAFALPAALFIAINVSLVASEAFASTLSTFLPSTNVCDAEDLVALVSLPLAWTFLWQQPSRPRAARGARRRGFGPVIVTMAAAMSCMATSAQPRPPEPLTPTHRAIYMSWDELRTSAVKVKGPEPVVARGKLLIDGDTLFLSDPGRGVHVFDNSDPKSPRALMFLEIPGNIDVAVRDGHLYADSFVDLLVFDLDLPNGTAKLIGRVEDQFEYDPHQTLTSDTPVFLGPIDRNLGVVVRLEPIQSTGEVAQ
jgi:hypothetical protein